MKNIILLFACMLISGILQAGTFEFRLVAAGSGTMAVEARETSGIGLPSTSSYVTDMVFGISWPKTYAVDLDGSTLTTSYKIAKSGGRMESGAFHYQSFYAKDTPYLFPTSWTIDTWVEVMRITNTLDGTGTGCFDISTTGFHASTDPNFGVDLSDFTPTITAGACGIVLPLELSKFEAHVYEKDKALLAWTTASETDTENFEIQQSTNAEDWTTVGQVQAADNSTITRNYRFIDDAPSNGINYYRLKMNDIGEAFEYSPIRVLEFHRKINSEMTVLPNPVKGAALVSLGQVSSGKLSLTAVDGKRLSTWQISASDQFQFSMEDIASGLYFLTFENEKGERVTSKIFKE